MLQLAGQSFELDSAYEKAIRLYFWSISEDKIVRDKIRVAWR